MYNFASLRLIALTIIYFHIGSVVAQEPASSIGDMLRNVRTELTKSKLCTHGADEASQYRNKGMWAESEITRNASAISCECIPNNASRMLSELPPSKLTQQIGELEFIQRYFPEIAMPCGQQVLASAYSETCPMRAVGSKSHPVNYCSCMSEQTKKLTPAEANGISVRSYQQLRSLDGGKIPGFSVPTQSTEVAKFSAMDQACSTQ